MSHTTDVAIIGGGVIGCSIAYQLSKKGIKSTVFEKNKLASGASGATAGIIGPIWYLDHTIKPYFDMGMRSLEIFPSLVEELKEAGIDPEFQQNGGMKIVLDEDTNTLLLDNLQLQHLFHAQHAKALLDLLRQIQFEFFGYCHLYFSHTLYFY